MTVLNQVVDFKKVFDALHWLKANNPHYRDVQIKSRAAFFAELEAKAISIGRDKNVQYSQGTYSDTDEDQPGPSSAQQPPAAGAVQEPSQANIMLSDKCGVDLSSYAFMSLDRDTPENAEALQNLQWLVISGKVIPHTVPHLDELCHPNLYPSGLL